MVLRRKVMVWLYRHDPDLRVLLLKRTKKEKGEWHPVTGNLEPREMPRQAAVRETFEETGWDAQPEPLGVTFTYETKEGPRAGRYHETAFAAHASDEDEIELSDEHEAHAWVTPDEARERLSFDEQKRALDALVQRYARTE